MSTDNTAVKTAAEPLPFRKMFTLDEANRSIVYVGLVVRDLMKVYQHVSGIRQKLEDPKSQETHEHLEAAYETGMDSLATLVDELHLVGVEVKSFDAGIIDFPAVHEGRDIFLCWKMGEEKVVSWHEVDAGYADRQNVTTLLEPARTAKRRRSA